MMKKIFSTAILLVLILTNTVAQQKLSKDLLIIKENCNRINSIKKWTKTKEVLDYKAYDEGTDNKVMLFYNNNKLEKIKVILYREMFKKETQYYFLNNELSFVIDKFTEYQSTYKTKAAKTKTDKLYFAKKELIYLVMEQDSGMDMPSGEDVYLLFQEEVDKIIKALK